MLKRKMTATVSAGFLCACLFLPAIANGQSQIEIDEFCIGVAGAKASASGLIETVSDAVALCRNDSSRCLSLMTSKMWQSMTYAICLGRGREVQESVALGDALCDQNVAALHAEAESVMLKLSGMVGRRIDCAAGGQ